jgi:L-iditol 2-dehydrogenase
MKAALLSGIKQFDIATVPDPSLARDTDVGIRIAVIGVCGSDIHYYSTGRIGTQVVRFPFTVGHETAGIVEKIGPRVTSLRVGQRVALDPAVSCGECDQCQAGRVHTCRHLQFMGCPGQLEGCMSQYVVVPDRNCFPIPDHMTFEQAAIAEPLAISVYSVERAPLSATTNIAILGAGPIGMSVLHTLRTRTVGNIYVTDRIDERLAYARKLHPRWTGNPDRVDVVNEILALEPLQVDVLFECTGDSSALAQAIELLKPGGTLVIVGIPEVDSISLPIHELRRKELTILNIRRQLHCTERAIALLASGAIRMDDMVTHRFALDETAKAFDLVANYRDGVMKAMIHIDHPAHHAFR